MVEQISMQQTVENSHDGVAGYFLKELQPVKSPCRSTGKV